MILVLLNEIIIVHIQIFFIQIWKLSFEGAFTIFIARSFLDIHTNLQKPLELIFIIDESESKT